jgi:hypothetical protein
MPLEPDMENQRLRDVDVDFPDDLTQAEFWQFVCSMGVNVFGERINETESGYEGRWDIWGSFERYMEEKHGKRSH